MPGDEFSVHDQVLLFFRDGGLEVFEGGHLKFPAEDGAVEFHGLAGGAVKGEIGVVVNSHAVSLFSCSLVAPYPTTSGRIRHGHIKVCRIWSYSCIDHIVSLEVNMAKKTGAVALVKKLAQNPAIRQKVIQLARDPKVQAEVKKYAGLALEAVKNRKSSGAKKLK